MFGSINLDSFFYVGSLPVAGRTVLADSFREEPGGKGANQAVAARRDQARVIMLGAVGTDSATDAAISGLRSAGVTLTHLQRSQSVATGRASICADRDGRNLIMVAAGANWALRAAAVSDELLAPGSTLLLQMENDPAEIAALVVRARARGLRVILNLAPAAALPIEILEALDVLIVNDDELEWLAQHLGVTATAGSLQARLGISVVHTRGARGVSASSTSGPSFELPAHAVEVVDSTAAGDCFTGVFAAALDRGAEFAAAVVRANVAGALACTRPGSQRSAPDAAEIDRFLHTHSAI